MKFNILCPVRWEKKKHLTLWFALFQVLSFLILPGIPAIIYLVNMNGLTNNGGIKGTVWLILGILLFVAFNVLKHFADKIQPTSERKRNLKFGIELIYGLAFCILWIVIVQLIKNMTAFVAELVVICMICRIGCLLIDTLFIKPLGQIMDVRSEAEHLIEVDNQKEFISKK